MGGSAGGIANDVFNPIGAGLGAIVGAAGGNQTAQNIVDPLGGAIQGGTGMLTGGSPPTAPINLGGIGQTGGSSPSNGINFGYQGLPSSFPNQSLTEGYQNIGNLYGALGQQAPGYYNQAQNATTQAQNQGVGDINSIYSGGLNSISGMENQNQSQVNNLLNNYDQSFVQSLGPQGQLGQQLMGEFNNYGITPQSGAFQSALGNQLGTLGAQNALTLGQQALQPGIQEGYNLLGQGTQQAGTLANLGGVQNLGLASEGALSPLSYANQAGNAQAGIINQAAELPIQYFQSQNESNLAQSLGQMNANAQQNAAQSGMLGNILGSGIGAGGSLIAAGK